MKEIFYCNTMNQFRMKMEELDFPRYVPVSYVIIDYEKSLYSKLDELPVIGRLNLIKQLGIAGTCTDITSLRYDAGSSRYIHSLICAAKMDHIAQTHDLDRNLGVAAGMLHDIATTPLSDSVSVELGMKDDKYFYRTLEKCPGVDELLEECSISKKELTKAVTGKSNSPIGQLINSKDTIDVDRWSYANWDASILGMLPNRWRGCQVTDPFKHIMVENGKVIFTDFDSVSQLLEARAQMFERVYRNPQLMAKEAFLGQITRSLLEKGIITEDSVFEMVDQDFEALVKEHGGEICRKIFGFDGFDTYGMVSAKKEDVTDFLKQNTERPFAIKKPKRCNPAVETPVMIDGKIDTYRNFEPEHAYELEQRMSAWNHTTVYGYENDRELAEAVFKAKKHFGVPKETFYLPNRNH